MVEWSVTVLGFGWEAWMSKNGEVCNVEGVLSGLLERRNLKTEIFVFEAESEKILTYKNAILIKCPNLKNL